MSKVPVQQPQSPLQSAQVSDKPLNVESLNIQGLDLNAIEHEPPLMLKDEAQSNLLTASILQQFQSSNQINTIRAAYVGSPVIRQKNRKCFVLLPWSFSATEKWFGALR